MINQFNKYIKDNNLVNRDDKILLAISGGIDSMVMAHLFLQSGYRIGIAHCNFSLRANDSDLDEKLVHDFALQNNLPFLTTRFDTLSFAKENGLSVQMAARELRYKWFEDIRIENGYDKIAVAHNLNDNIETLLINLIRGTGITGLTGMKPIINRIVRPLLFATRNEIMSYCNSQKIIYREDKSNADTKYTRNKIRHLVIPVLKEINPSIETTLNETAERLSGISEIITEYINELKEKITEQQDKNISFNIRLLNNHIPNKTILFELFKPYGVTNVMLKDLTAVIEGKTGGQILTNTHRIIKNRKELIVSAENQETETFYQVNDIEGFKNIPGIVSAVFTDIADKYEIPSNPYIACLDSDKVKFPLIIRNWRAGDHFYPLGMKQKKKLSDYFIDNKYSILDKENRLILESEGRIVWIIGDRIDNRYRITKSTKRVLLVRTATKELIIKPIR